MKTIGELLLFFAFFLIMAGPLLIIAGHFYGKVFISEKEYILIILFFIAAVSFYLCKK